MVATNYNKRLEAMSERRIAERDRRIRAMGRPVNVWTRDIKERLLGVVAGGRGSWARMWPRIGDILDAVPQQGADLLEDVLRDFWGWAYGSAVQCLLLSVPTRYWVRRFAPVELLAQVEGRLHEDALPDFSPWERILRGEASEEEARQIVRENEFGESTPEQVDRILAATNAPDGLSAMERIKTVAAPDIEQLRTVIRAGMTGDITGASAVASITKQIVPLLDVDEGLNWKAKRIARTEGVRIAEAAQREAWDSVSDMLDGIQTMTAADSNVRAEHRQWHDKFFKRTDAGYIASDGEQLPEFPAGPNCRCYTTQVLRSDLYQDVPPVNWGAYTTAKARADKEEPRKTKAKAKPKPKPKPKPTVPAVKRERSRLTAAERDKYWRVPGGPADADEYAKQTFNHGWAQKLPRSQHESLDLYQGPEYQDINKHLRGQFVDPTVWEKGELEKHVKNIDAVIAKTHIKEDMVVYRGIGGKTAKQFKRQKNIVGKCYSDKAYTSTTLCKEVAVENFADGVVMEIYLPKGMNAAALTPINEMGEAEILLGRGTKLEITGREVRGGQLWLRAEVVP